jgi:hypothetical protein
MVGVEIIAAISCILCTACCFIGYQEKRRRENNMPSFCGNNQLQREQHLYDLRENAVISESERIDKLEAFIRRQAMVAAENQLNGETPKATPSVGTPPQPPATSPPTYLHPAVARQLATSRPILFQPGCGPYGAMHPNPGVAGYFYQ